MKRRRAIGRLADLIPGEQAELAEITPFGGDFYSRSVPAGTRVFLSWHQPGATFVRVFDQGWSDPVSMSSDARVARVIQRVETSEATPPAEDTDPLTRHSVESPLWRR